MDKILKIEITDYCNAKCIFCNYDKTNTHMPYEQFVEIVSQMPEIKRIEPQHLGEPMMHPQFLNILYYLRKNDKSIAFHTNASLLKGKMAETIAGIAPEIIRFSVEGDNKETYEKLRVGLKWDTVLGNIEKFQAIKSDQTETQVAMLATKEIKKDIKRIVRFWEERVDKVIVVPEMPQGRKLKGKLRDKPFRCWKIEKMITIKVNGDIVICCNDWNSQYVIGNIRDGIKNVLKDNNEYLSRLTKSIQDGKPLSICKECPVFWEGE